MFYLSVLRPPFICYEMCVNPPSPHDIRKTFSPNVASLEQCGLFFYFFMCTHVTLSEKSSSLSVDLIEICTAGAAADPSTEGNKWKEIAHFIHHGGSSLAAENYIWSLHSSPTCKWHLTPLSPYTPLHFRMPSDPCPPLLTPPDIYWPL